jgi:hypothetical protein
MKMVSFFIDLFKNTPQTNDELQHLTTYGSKLSHEPYRGYDFDMSELMGIDAQLNERGGVSIGALITQRQEVEQRIHYNTYRWEHGERW